MHHGPRKILDRARDHLLEVNIGLQFNPQVHPEHIPRHRPNLGDPRRMLLISMML